jgi:hypothetical protein
MAAGHLKSYKQLSKAKSTSNMRPRRTARIPEGSAKKELNSSIPQQTFMLLIGHVKASKADVKASKAEQSYFLGGITATYHCLDIGRVLRRVPTPIFPGRVFFSQRARLFVSCSAYA